jgi:hypothetical protein
MTGSQSSARAAIIAASALLAFSSAGEAVSRERAVRATREDCAVITAVFSTDESMASLENLLAGPISYGPVDGTYLKASFPELTDAEVSDLVAGAPTQVGERFILACDWRKLGFRPSEWRTYVRDYPWSTVSRPVIGASGRIAFVGTYAQWASLAGEGRDCLLRKTDGAWRVQACRFDGIVS